MKRPSLLVRLITYSLIVFGLNNISLWYYLDEQVKFNAVKEHNKEQFPGVRGSEALGEDWMDWKL